MVLGRGWEVVKTVIINKMSTIYCVCTMYQAPCYVLYLLQSTLHFEVDIIFVSYGRGTWGLGRSLPQKDTQLREGTDFRSCPGDPRACV